ncbi:MAG: hypothetical protein ABIT01_12635 [Thermoanaerobaculia bacterium]
MAALSEAMLSEPLLRVAIGLGGVLFFLVAGNGLASCFPVLRSVRRGGRLGISYLLGVASVSGAVYALSHLFRTPIRTASIGTALVFIGAGLVTRLRNRPEAALRSTARIKRRTQRLAAVALLIGGFSSLGILMDALARPVTDWDSRMTWNTQARYIRGDGRVDARALADPAVSLAHPRYPVLMPLAQVIVQEVFSAGEDDRLIRPLYAAFYPALLLTLYEAAAFLVGAPWAGAAVLAATLAPFIAFESHGGATGCYSDLPLACFWGTGLLLLCRKRLEISTGLLAGILLGAAILTKNEGLPLALSALAAAGSMTLGSVHRARRWPVFLASVPALLAAWLLWSWRSHIPERFDENYLAGASLGKVLRGFAANAGEIARGIFSASTRLDHWGLLWCAVALIVMLGAKSLVRRPGLPLSLALAGALATYLSAYALTGGRLPELIEVTWGRFLLQMSLPLLVLFALALKRIVDPEPV